MLRGLGGSSCFISDDAARSAADCPRRPAIPDNARGYAEVVAAFGPQPHPRGSPPQLCYRHHMIEEPPQTPTRAASKARKEREHQPSQDSKRTWWRSQPRPALSRPSLRALLSWGLMMNSGFGRTTAPATRGSAMSKAWSRSSALRPRASTKLFPNRSPGSCNERLRSAGCSGAESSSASNFPPKARKSPCKAPAKSPTKS